MNVKLTSAKGYDLRTTVEVYAREKDLLSTVQRVSASKKALDQAQVLLHDTRSFRTSLESCTSKEQLTRLLCADFDMHENEARQETKELEKHVSSLVENQSEVMVQEEHVRRKLHKLLTMLTDENLLHPSLSRANLADIREFCKYNEKYEKLLQNSDLEKFSPYHKIDVAQLSNPDESTAHMDSNEPINTTESTGGTSSETGIASSKTKESLDANEKDGAPNESSCSTDGAPNESNFSTGGDVTERSSVETRPISDTPDTTSHTSARNIDSRTQPPTTQQDDSSAKVQSVNDTATFKVISLDTNGKNFRFKINTSYDAFHELLNKKLSLPLSQYCLTWKDDDGDHIAIESADDFDEAVETLAQMSLSHTSKTGKSALVFYIKHQPSPSSCLDSDKHAWQVHLENQSMDSTPAHPNAELSPPPYGSSSGKKD